MHSIDWLNSLLNTFHNESTDRYVIILTQMARQFEYFKKMEAGARSAVKSGWFSLKQDGWFWPSFR